jgi:SAM-dependent methyltransferase
MDLKFAQQYERRYRTHWWFRARESLLKNALKNIHFATSPAILDVGCGNGLGFEMLDPIGDAEGVEGDSNIVSPDGPNASRIFVGDFVSDYTPDKRFDLITMFDVLEHFENRAAVLEKIRTLLNPGGRLLLSVPALPWVWTHHDDLNHHYIRYTKQSLRNELLSEGFSETSLEYHFTWLVPVKFLFRMKERIMTSSSDSMEVPAPWFNKTLYTLARLEQQFFTLKAPAPVGTSIVGIFETGQ